MRHVRSASAGVLALALLVACGSEAAPRGTDPATTPAGSPAGPLSPTPTRPPASSLPEAEEDETIEVSAVLQFEAPRLGGGTVRGEDYAGKSLALWFWAPW